MPNTFSIEFTRPVKNKPLSWLIRLFERSEFSHVRIRWINSHGQDLIYEASGSEVKFVGPLAQKKYQVSIIKSYSIPLNQQEYSRLIKVCIKYAGVKYGKMQLVGMAIARIFKLSKNPFGDKEKTQVCSEVVHEIIEEVKMISSNINPEIDGPKALEKEIAKLYPSLIP